MRREIYLDLCTVGALHPDVYVQEVQQTQTAIQSIQSGVAAWLGVVQKGPIGKPIPVQSFTDASAKVGGFLTSSYLMYCLKAYYDVSGSGLNYVVRIVHCATGAQVAAGATVVAMPEGGTPNSASVLNINLPDAVAALPVGTPLAIGDQVAIVKSVSITAPNSATTQLVTLLSPLQLGIPTNSTPVTDWDTEIFRTSAPSQLFLNDSGGAGGAPAPTLLIQSIYDGTFYNGISISTKANPILTTTLVDAIIAGATTAVLTSVQNLQIGHLLKVGNGNTSETTEYKAVIGINGTTVTFDSAFANGYAALQNVTEQSFDFIVTAYNSPTPTEYFQQLSMGRNAPNYIVSALSSLTSGSQYVVAFDLVSNNGWGNQPAVVTNDFLVGGLDGITNPVTGAFTLTDNDYIGNQEYHTGLYALDALRHVVLHINVPGITTENVMSALSGYVLNRLDCCGYFDSPAGYTPSQMETLVDEQANIDSSYCFMYYPWVSVPDPIGAGPNPTKLIPPCGYAIGIAARTDKLRGIYKAPAGSSAVLTTAVGLEYRVTDTDQDSLNPIGVNCIRYIQNSGICIMGARTLSSGAGDTQFNYVNVRRMFLQMEKEIQLGTRWAIFEPNDQTLWEKLYLNVTAYGTAKYNKRWFRGATPAQAFVVVSDATTNPTGNIDQGIVTVFFGACPSKPGEFIFFKVAQYSQGTTVAELPASPTS